MKAAKTTIALLFFTATLNFSVTGKDLNTTDKAMTMFKNYLNNMVQKVEKASTPGQKRQIMNNSFNKMIDTFDRISKMTTSVSNKEALESLKSKVQANKDELNGKNGYKRIKQGKLDQFAKYTLQNFEQADTITLSLTAALLILILVILLF